MNKNKKIIVEEVLRKIISIECDSIEKGKMQIADSYDNSEVVLDYDDLWATNIYSERELESHDNLLKKYKYLSKPLTTKEVYEKMDVFGYINEIVAVSVLDLLNHNIKDSEMHILKRYKEYYL